MKKNIKKFLFPAKKLKKLYTKIFFVSFVMASFDVFSIYVLKIATKAIEKSDYILLQNIIYVFICCIIVYYILSWFFKYRIGKVLFKTKEEVYNKTIKDFLLLDNNGVETLGVWRTISILEDWIESWSRLMNELVNWTLKDLLKIILSFIFIFFLFPKYFLYSILMFCLIWIIAYFSNKYIKKWRSERKKWRGIRVNQLIKIIMSKFEILQNWKISREINLLNDYNNNEFLANCKVEKWVWGMFFIPEFLLDILKLLVIIIIWKYVIDWKISIWDFVALSSIVVLLKSTVNKFTQRYKNFWKEFTNIQRLFDFFDSTPHLKWYDTWKNYLYKNWSIHLENIDFSYWDKQIFSNFNLQIEGWKKYAFVGPSWGGKSTLIKLISGYITSNSWEIIIDDQKLSQTKLSSYYKHIWYLTQDPSVFDGSIYENLVYALNYEPEKEELENVIKLSKCEFIYDFKDWLETQIWEKWIKLSWWQKQRLAIAKIMLKNPKIILLDEPTSALDSFNEEQISQALNNLFIWKTVIVVAHRLQTVKKSDCIFYLDSWEIIEQWTHEELLSKKWNYHKMIELQSWF